MSQDRWRDDERRREFERDRERYAGGYRPQSGEFDYDRDVYGQRYARNQGWSGEGRFQGDRDRERRFGGREHEHEQRERERRERGHRESMQSERGMYGATQAGAFGAERGRPQSDYYGAGREQGYERNRGHEYDWNRGYDRNEPYRRREHEMRGGGRDEDRSWWDRTRDEVSSWFGDDEAERRRHEDEMRGGGHEERRFQGGYGERRNDTAWNDPVRGGDYGHRRTDLSGSRDERRFEDRERHREDERRFWRDQDRDRWDRRPR
jgi:hypothetical protein